MMYGNQFSSVWKYIIIPIYLITQLSKCYNVTVSIFEEGLFRQSLSLKKDHSNSLYLEEGLLDLLYVHPRLVTLDKGMRVLQAQEMIVK